MAVIEKDLGPVSAYAVAVAHGYTGTEAEWEALIANSAANAESAGASATAAANSAQTAASKAIQAQAQAAAAQQSATAASQSSQTAGQANSYAQMASSNAARSAAAAGDAQTAAEAAQAAAEAAQAAAETAEGNIATEGAAQISAIQAKGQQTLESIPDDYTSLSNSVVDLKSAFEDFADANATIYPTGDTTDRRQDILAILNAKGICYFAPGEYTIATALTLPAKSKLYGAGKQSHIIMGSSAVGQMINAGEGCQISHLWFDGGLTQMPANTSTNRHGVRIQNNADTLQMSNCWVTGFGGTGVRVDNTGYRDLSSVQITNCYFAHNGIGINFLEHGEYGVVSNCSIIDNYFGLRINGGNNIATGCAIERNNVGATVDGTNTDNSGHGAFIGCSFNHNADIGLQITATTNGYLVSGCQFFRNTNFEISINASGVNVTGCQFGTSTHLRFNTNCVASIADCMFVGSPTLNYIGDAVVNAKNNYKFDGEKAPLLKPGQIEDETAFALRRFNADNLLGYPSVAYTTVNGIGYRAVNGVYTLVSGTASAFTTINIGDTIAEYPMDVNEGDRIYAYLSDAPINGVFLQVLPYGGSTIIFQTATDGWFTMPSDLSTPLRIRISVTKNTVLSGQTVTPYLGKSPAGNVVGHRLYPDDLPAMLTIIDDDGHSGFYTDLLPIIRGENVPIATAIPIVSVGTANHMTWEQIGECYASGAEILSHTYSHQTTYDNTWTAESIQRDYQMARNILTAHGLDGGKYIVFSGTTGEDDRAKKAAPYVCEMAINSAGNAINHRGNWSQYRIKRYRIQTDGIGYDTDELKALIDTCLADGGWMVWMMHTSDPETWDATAKAHLVEAIQYAKAEGLPIVTVDYANRAYRQLT